MNGVEINSKDELPSYITAIADDMFAELQRKGGYLFGMVSSVTTSLHEIFLYLCVPGVVNNIKNPLSLLGDLVPEEQLEVLFEWVGLKFDKGEVSILVEGDENVPDFRKISRKLMAFNRYFRGKRKAERGSE